MAAVCTIVRFSCCRNRVVVVVAAMPVLFVVTFSVTAAPVTGLFSAVAVSGRVPISVIVWKAAGATPTVDWRCRLLFCFAVVVVVVRRCGHTGGVPVLLMVVTEDCFGCTKGVDGGGKYQDDETVEMLLLLVGFACLS